MQSQKLESISPRLATKYLEKAAPNRHLSQARVLDYVRLIVSDRWPLTHQGIAFNDCGQLIDGQHRLHAIIASGKAVPMWVARNVENGANLFIDLQRPRTDADSFSIETGERWTNSEVAVGRILYASHLAQHYEQNFNTALARRSLCDRVTQLDFLRYHKQAIAYSSPRSNMRGGKHASIRAAISAAWHTCERTRLDEFMEVFYTGVSSSKDHDVMAIKLRDIVLQGNHSHGGSSVRGDLFLKSCKAIKLFMERTSMSRICATAEQIFPLPKGNHWPPLNDD